MRRYFGTLLLVVTVAIGVLAQEGATISADDILVKAGEDFKFTVTFDKAPNFEGGAVGFAIAGPEGLEHGGLTGFCGQRRSEPRVNDCKTHVYATAVGGVWTLVRLYFTVGTKFIDLKVAPLSFRVIPNQNLVLPTGAEITVNLDQAQLLRREATRLEGRIQSLKSTIAKYGQANTKGTLRDVFQRNLKEEIQALEATEAEYLKLMTANDQTPAQVFFSDLRLNYENALALTDERSSATKNKTGLLLLVADKMSKERNATPSLLALAILRPFEQNETAYKTVVDTGALFFDLEIDSNPTGATVSYYRRGDSPRQNPNPTNSTIHSLPYAIWNIRLEKKGYQVEEREYDPFREPNHVVNVALRKQ